MNRVDISGTDIKATGQRRHEHKNSELEFRGDMNTKILNWGSGAKPVKQFGSKANKSLITLSFFAKKHKIEVATMR